MIVMGIDMGKEGISGGDKLLEFSLRLNKLIADYAKENDIKIVVSSQGFQQYPDQYPGQEYIQLFNVIP